MSEETITMTRNDFEALKQVASMCNEAHFHNEPPSGIGAGGWIEEAEKVISKIEKEYSKW